MPPTTLFRSVATERPDLLDIPTWPYARLAADWGGTGLEASTAAQLRDALAAAHQCAGFVVIDVHIGRNDLSPVSIKYIEAAAARSRPAADGKA